MKYFCIVLTCLLGLAAIGCNHRAIGEVRTDPKVVEELRAKLSAGGASTDAAAPTEAPKATGWATLKGTFKLTSAPPAPTPIAAAKTHADCSKHAVFDETVAANPDGTLKGAVVYLRTPDVEIHDDYKANEAKEVILDNKNCRFEPHVVTMRTTQPLLIKNSDPFGHNSNILAVKNAPANPLIPADSTSEQKFPKEEPNPIKVGCSIHPWMGGWIVVRKDPYAAASDDKGSFTLANVPAGRPLEFQLWQEKNGPLKGDGVTIEGHPEVKVDGKGRFKLTLKPDEVVDLVFNVAADKL